MGKTYKRTPLYGYRHPRGKRNAVINGARPKAVPPDDWDDVLPCKTTGMPWTLAQRMKKKGLGKETAVRKILRKCKKTKRNEAEDAVRSTWKYD